MLGSRMSLYGLMVVTFLTAGSMLLSCSALETDGIIGLPVDESAFEPLPVELTYEPSEQVLQQVVASAPAVLAKSGVDVNAGSVSLGNPIPAFRVERNELVKLATDLWPVYRGEEYIGYLVAATYDDEDDADSVPPLSRWKSFSLPEQEVSDEKTAYSDCVFVPRTSGAAERYVERVLTREGACAYVDGVASQMVMSPDDDLVVAAFMAGDEDAEKTIRTPEEIRARGLRYGSAIGRIPLG